MFKPNNHNACATTVCALLSALSEEKKPASTGRPASVYRMRGAIR